MIPAWRTLLVFAFLCSGAQAQWLNYPTPGMPRTRDGKPNLSAPAPRAPNGKPDLSGVWLHEQTSLAEMKRLFGSGLVDGAATLSVPGMELETVSKYGVNILVDFKPEDSPMRPEAAAIFRKRATGLEDRGTCLPVGIPIAGLVSEPNKIVQSPRLIVIMYESDGSHRQIYTDGRGLPAESSIARSLRPSASSPPVPSPCPRHSSWNSRYSSARERFRVRTSLAQTYKSRRESQTPGRGTWRSTGFSGRRS